MARIYVGTCGWVYGAWKERFYPPTLPDAQRLGYFANRFETTEVNYSFYQVPSVDTYKKWLEVVPSHFVFALKANRLITHAARLRDVESAWADCLTGATALGPQLGPILLQLSARSILFAPPHVTSRREPPIDLIARTFSWASPDAAYEMANFR